MSLESIINYISNSQITKELITRINQYKELNVIGSNRYAKALIINSIANKEKKNILSHYQFWKKTLKCLFMNGPKKTLSK